MIKSELPHIVSHQGGNNLYQWRLFVSADLAFFNGHFPQQAVLPGVTPLDWAVKLGCEAFGYSATIATLEVLKFQQLILPDTYVDLVIEHQVQKAKLIFSYRDQDKRFSSGRIVVKPALVTAAPTAIESNP
ncbi:MAG: 3-hydroxymyristoyl/3-hydroxydecanoyl-(acyl carrier protein) dehydratase [Shewanella psychromarinicola]|jgi:3-hydroxymyristoyl/3-hydroxydecanoyl-(acyl carrier protein) dehydratase|uniref:ApeI family dehydratase n=1 Tax=Shewanella psychromarinicola TaxID=2487742 RepID=UPI003EEBE19D